MHMTLLTICCWLLLVWAPSGRAELVEVPIALVGGVVIDGNGGIPIENGVVVIRGRTVVSVGDANRVVIPDNAQVVDVSGKAILPGLADMHVHLMGGWDGESGDMLGYQRYLDALLYAGVTTVLDMGNVTPFVVQLRDEIAAGNIVGPRIYCVGPLIDGAAPRWPAFSVGLISESQVPEVIALLKRSRVDAVKAYMGLSVPLLDDLVSAAADHSLPVFVDVGDRNGSFDVAALGISAFAHLPTRPLGPSVIALAADRDIRFVSTLAQQERSARRRLNDLSLRRCRGSFVACVC